MDNVLSHRRIAVSAESSSHEEHKASPSPLQYHTKQADQSNLYSSKQPPLSHRAKLNQYQKTKWTSIAAAALALILILHITNGNKDGIPKSIPQYASSGLLRHSSEVAEPQSNIILMASHLRQGSDGQLRLRIIEHNLHFLFSPNHYEKGEEERKAIKQPSSLKSILIFSFDPENISKSSNANGAVDTVHAMVDKWRSQIRDPTIQISKILFVPNNAVLVDASKWMTALHELLPEIQSTRAHVMLTNDSFLLTRPVPELWNENTAAANSKCTGEVCGLVWTAPLSDPTRHIQSYVRTLSACAIERYMAFYEESMGKVHNVHELIKLFEINLEWAGVGKGDRGCGHGADGGIAAIYDYAGAHPDADAAQKILVSKGYPAIKLKKFFITQDPWLLQDDATRPHLPPTFSKSIYKQMNHDLNHLGDSDLERHFAMHGKNEERIHGKLPLVIKGWLREELLRMREESGVDSTIAILEDYLVALNAAIAKIE